MKDLQYQFSIRPLSLEEGGGFAIEFPDLPGCISDGDTIKEAIANGEDAVKGWLDTCKKLSREIPKPNQQSTHSGKVLLRLPKYLHAKSAHRAELEGVSLNSLIQTFIAEGLGRKNILENKQITTAKAYMHNTPINAVNLKFTTSDATELKENFSLTNTTSHFEQIKH